MKISLLIIFVVISNCSFGKPIDTIIKILENKNFYLFDNYIINYKSSNHCSSAEEQTNRKIILNYNEVVANIIIFEPTPNGKTEGDCNYYKINLTTQGNEIISFIIYFKPFEEDGTNGYVLIKQYSNDSELNKLQELYKNSFFRSLNLSELFESGVVYGEHCGIGGVNPNKRDSLELLIKSNNYNKLFHWLTSPCYEKKIYGYEGYKALISSGYSLNEKEKTIINNLGDFIGKVKTCNGCSSWDIEFQEIKKQIDYKKFDTLKPEIKLNHNNVKETTNYSYLYIFFVLLFLFIFLYKLNKKK